MRTALDLRYDGRHASNLRLCDQFPLKRRVQDTRVDEQLANAQFSPVVKQRHLGAGPGTARGAINVRFSIYHHVATTSLHVPRRIVGLCHIHSDDVREGGMLNSQL